MEGMEGEGGSGGEGGRLSEGEGVMEGFRGGSMGERKG